MPSTCPLNSPLCSLKSNINFRIEVRINWIGYNWDPFEQMRVSNIQENCFSWGRGQPFNKGEWDSRVEVSWNPWRELLGRNVLRGAGSLSHAWQWAFLIVWGVPRMIRCIKGFQIFNPLNSWSPRLVSILTLFAHWWKCGSLVCHRAIVHRGLGLHIYLLFTFCLIFKSRILNSSLSIVWSIFFIGIRLTFV
jgi:hypothetical protein